MRDIIKTPIIAMLNFSFSACIGRKAYAFMVFVLPLLLYGVFYLLIYFRFMRFVLANIIDFNYIDDDFFEFQKIIFDGVFLEYYFLLKIILIFASLHRLNSYTKNKIIKTILMLIFLVLITINPFKFLNIESSIYLSIIQKIFICSCFLLLKENYKSEIIAKSSIALFFSARFSEVARTNFIIIFSIFLLIYCPLVFFGLDIAFFIYLYLLPFIALIVFLLLIDMFFIFNRFKDSFTKNIFKSLCVICFISFYIFYISFDRSTIFYDIIAIIFICLFCFLYFISLILLIIKRFFNKERDKQNV